MRLIIILWFFLTSELLAKGYGISTYYGPSYLEETQHEPITGKSWIQLSLPHKCVCYILPCKICIMSHVAWFKADWENPGKFWKEIRIDSIKCQWRQGTSDESNVPSRWTGKGHLLRPSELKSGEERYTLYLTVQSVLVLWFNGAEIWKANRCNCSHYPSNHGAIHHNMLIIYCWSCPIIWSRLSGSFLYNLYHLISFLT